MRVSVRLVVHKSAWSVARTNTSRWLVISISRQGSLISIRRGFRLVRRVDCHICIAVRTLLSCCSRIRQLTLHSRPLPGSVSRNHSPSPLAAWAIDVVQQILEENNKSGSYGTGVQIKPSFMSSAYSITCTIFSHVLKGGDRVYARYCSEVRCVDLRLMCTAAHILLCMRRATRPSRVHHSHF